MSPTKYRKEYAIEVHRRLVLHIHLHVNPAFRHIACEGLLQLMRHPATGEYDVGGNYQSRWAATQLNYPIQRQQHLAS
jgi:hypothetical protein